MKQFKSTGILVLVVAAVASYAYFGEYRSKIEKETQEAESKKIIPFSLEDITEFTVKSPAGEFVFVKYKAEKNVKWFIEKPVKDIADYGAIQGYLSQFGAEKFDDIAASGTGIDFEIFGLNDKSNSVTFKKGAESLVIHVGSATALAGKKYIRINSEEKILIADYFWESQFQKNLSEFREKALVPNDFKFSKFDIKNRTPSGIEQLAFVKQDGKWVLSNLLTQDPDQKILDDVYYQIQNIRAAQILKEGKSPSDLNNFGLSDPDVKVSLHGEDRDLDISFSRNITGQVYAITSERDVIFSLNPPAVTPLRRAVDDYRDKKKPLSFNLSDVNEINFKSDLSSFNLTKSENTWKSKEKIDGKVVDNEKVVDILSKLSMMRVKKYFDQGVDSQKSGMIELKLKSAQGSEVLDLKWSPKPVDDVFVATSNLSEKTFGLSMQDVGSLPFQAVVVDPPKPTTKSDLDGMHIPSLKPEEKKVK